MAVVSIRCHTHAHVGVGSPNLVSSHASREWRDKNTENVELFPQFNSIPTRHSSGTRALLSNAVWIQLGVFLLRRFRFLPFSASFFSSVNTSYVAAVVVYQIPYYEICIFRWFRARQLGSSAKMFCCSILTSNFVALEHKHRTEWDQK